MKTMGLIGGMSWESTELYYRIINEETKRRRGGLHSAPLLMSSLDFEPIEKLQHDGNWQGCADVLIGAARQLEGAGADFVLICTNTMHRVAKEVEAAVDIPLLHIADATADSVERAGHDKIGLLGTRFTMEEDFYKNRLEDRGISVLTPPESDRALVHRVIYDELCQGKVSESSRKEFVRIIADLQFAGAQAVIEGCTEIVMLVKQAHTPVTLFDTTAIHATSAVELALQ